MSETAARAFDIFDKHKSGQFDYETFKKIARSAGEEWNEEELYEMFVIADKNNDGVIDRSEFMEILERIGLDG
ncbi:Centrin-3 [Umbelopsis sp. WA50703]|jgi:Ca2+-binding EF-hand superfamily protein